MHRLVRIVASGVWPLLAGAQEPAMPVFATGLEPVDEATYAALPGVNRYRAFLPEKVDLTARFPKPGYQGQQGSCSAWATTYAARSFLAQSESAGGPSGDAVMSPAYVFNQTRPGPGCMKGTDLPRALTFLRDVGTVPMSQFMSDDCSQPPPVALSGTAARYRIGKFEAVAHRNARTGKLNDDWRDPVVLDDIKGALARGRPVVFAMELPSDFTAGQMGQTGVYRSSDRFDRWGGASGKPRHGMALVGYDDTKRAFRLINSWGTHWGDQGYLWIDYETFGNLVGEAYVVQPARGADPAPAPVPVVPKENPQDRLTRALDVKVCGKLSVRWQGDNAVVEGFANPDDLAQVRTRAGNMPNVQWKVRSVPFPACEAELLVSEGLSDGSVRLGIGDARGKPLDAPVVALTEDALFSIDVESSAKPYIQVFYLQADGSAVELYRGAPAPDAQGRRRIRVGAGGTAEKRFQVAEPFGDEALIAVAGTRPIIAEPLGTLATEREFLSRLRAAVIAAKGARPSATLRRLRSVKRG